MANNTIKAVPAKLEIAAAQRYTPRGFRIGASSDLKTQGPPVGQCSQLGWVAPHRLPRYVDLTPELDRDMSKLLIETEDIDSDLGVDARTLDARSHLTVPFASDLGCWAPASFRVGISFSQDFIYIFSYRV